MSPLKTLFIINMLICMLFGCVSKPEITYKTSKVVPSLPQADVKVRKTSSEVSLFPPNMLTGYKPVAQPTKTKKRK